MRYATFSLPQDPRPRPGIVEDDQITELDAASLLDVIRGPGTAAAGLGTRPPSRVVSSDTDKLWRGRAEAQRAKAGDSGLGIRADARPAGTTHALSAVRLHAPIPRPAKNVFCVGRNYAAHVKEGAAAYNREVKLPEVPVFFTKAPTTVAGPFDDVPLHRGVTQQLDWEVELAVVIGREGRDISRDAALSHVFGYAVLNDITARDLQQRHTQWFKGKSLDGSCPFGPVIVTADEFGDPQTKRVSLRVNGVTKQDATTADMIFPVAIIIEWLSKGLTLEPGDIIATGTPEGVGMGRTPQEWLQAGDVIEAEVEGIGVIRNRVVDR